MDTKKPENYQVEDFVTDESFSNYHFCLNTADQLFWESWVLQHPDKITMVEEAKNILNMLSLTLHKNEYKEEFKHIRDAINIEPTFLKRNPHNLVRLLNWNKPETDRKRKKRVRSVLLVTLLLVILIGGYFFIQQLGTNETSFITKHNESNKEQVFTLEDGTVITLASNSSLEYPLIFKEKERKVYLHGEARFQVTKDKDHPFKVYQDNIIATVLGTTFNVKKQPGDSIISVELITGKLQVEALASPGSLPQSIILEPDQRAVYVFNKKQLFKEVWKQNNEEYPLKDHLAFKQSNFEEIAKKMKGLFGVTLINQSSKKTWRFTGEFSNTTAKEVMENICLIKKLNLEIRRDTFLINNAGSIK